MVKRETKFKGFNILNINKKNIIILLGFFITIFTNGCASAVIPFSLSIPDSLTDSLLLILIISTGFFLMGLSWIHAFERGRNPWIWTITTFFFGFAANLILYNLNQVKENEIAKYINDEKLLKKNEYFTAKQLMIFSNLSIGIAIIVLLVGTFFLYEGQYRSGNYIITTPLAGAGLIVFVASFGILISGLYCFWKAFYKIRKIKKEFQLNKR